MLTQEDKEQIAQIIQSSLFHGGSYAGPERRHSPLSEEAMDQIAERAAERALNHVYTAIGKSVIAKALWICGAACLAAAAWLAGAGHIKP